MKAVANEVEVRLPTSSERTDTDIAKAVAQALEWDVVVLLEELDVTVPLPPGLDLDRANARLKDGVLTVRFPKVDTRPGMRRVPIKH